MNPTSLPQDPSKKTPEKPNPPSRAPDPVRHSQPQSQTPDQAKAQTTNTAPNKPRPRQHQDQPAHTLSTPEAKPLSTPIPIPISKPKPPFKPSTIEQTQDPPQLASQPRQQRAITGPPKPSQAKHHLPSITDAGGQLVLTCHEVCQPSPQGPRDCKAPFPTHFFLRPKAATMFRWTPAFAGDPLAEPEAVLPVRSTAATAAASLLTRACFFLACFLAFFLSAGAC